MPSKLLHARLAEKILRLHPRTAEKLELPDGSEVTVSANNWAVEARVQLDETVPFGLALVPRSVGIPISAPLAATVALRVPEPEGLKE